MVECQLPKLDVAGSTPVSRSNNQSLRLDRGGLFIGNVRMPEAERSEERGARNEGSPGLKPHAGRRTSLPSIFAPRPSLLFED